MEILMMGYNGIEWDLMEYVNGYNDICVICFFGTVPFFSYEPSWSRGGKPTYAFTELRFNIDW